MDDVYQSDKRIQSKRVLPKLNITNLKKHDKLHNSLDLQPGPVHGGKARSAPEACPSATSSDVNTTKSCGNSDRSVTKPIKKHKDSASLSIKATCKSPRIRTRQKSAVSKTAGKYTLKTNRYVDKESRTPTKPHAIPLDTPGLLIPPIATAHYNTRLLAHKSSQMEAKACALSDDDVLSDESLPDPAPNTEPELLGEQEYSTPTGETTEFQSEYAPTTTHKTLSLTPEIEDQPRVIDTKEKADIYIAFLEEAAKKHVQEKRAMQAVIDQLSPSKQQQMDTLDDATAAPADRIPEDVINPNKRKQPGSPTDYTSQGAIPKQLELFKSPKKTKKLKSSFITKPMTTTSNTFEALEIEDIVPQVSTQDDIAAATRQSLAKSKPTPTAKIQQKQPPKPQQPPKNPNFPPIVIPGIPSNHRTFIQDISENTTSKFYIKYSANSVLVYTSTINDYEKVINILKNSNREYHTYTPKAEKHHAFVLRGLDAEIAPRDIIEDVQDEHDITILNVFKMRTRGRPLYLAIFNNDVTLPQLQTSIKYILSTKVIWEKRRSERRITQCRRCQLWGHSAINCARAPRCMKCADSHLTMDCTKTPDTPAKCCNCRGDHPASSIQCPTYITRIAALDKLQHPQQQQQRPLYQPAPPPAVNAWATRSRQQPPPGAYVANSGAPPSQRPAQSQHDAHRPTDQTASLPVTKPQDNSVVQAAAETSSILRDLSAEFGILNSLTDLKQMLLALRELNSLLSSAPDSLSRLQAMNQFVTTILPKYNV